MLSPETRLVDLAAHTRADRWRRSNAAAVGAVPDTTGEAGVEVACLATLIDSTVSGRLAQQGMTRDRKAAVDAEVPLRASDVGARWDAFMAGLERRVLSLGAAGLSLGLAHGSRLHTFNRGFSQRTCAVYATISADADLPGPATLRSAEAQYFESHEIASARYPKSAGIHAGTGFSAAACLPLVFRGERAAFGYLAVHYVGPRDFDDRDRAVLSRTATFAALGIHRLVIGTRGGHDVREGDRSNEELRSELAGLHEAMKTRAGIEQAKGMLMERFDLDVDQAWNLLRRISSETNVKVTAIADALVRKADVRGLPSGGPKP